jgi:hypothetical protein
VGAYGAIEDVGRKSIQYWPHFCFQSIMEKVVPDVESGVAEAVPQKVKNWSGVILLCMLLGSITSVVFGTFLVLTLHHGQSLDSKLMIGYGSAFVFGLLLTAGACGFACGQRTMRPIHPA